MVIGLTSPGHIKRRVRRIDELYITIMEKGKLTCKILKGIRQQIADANGISYRPKECHYEGECSGTCPACEQEIRYLETQLRERNRKGWSMKVAGLAAGICVATVPLASCSNSSKTDSKVQKTLDSTLQEENVNEVKVLKPDKKDSVVISGQTVMQFLNNPLDNTVVCRLGDRRGIVLGEDGRFTLRVNRSDTLVFSNSGFEDYKLVVDTIKNPNNIIVCLQWVGGPEKCGGIREEPLKSENVDKTAPKSHKEKCNQK